MEGHLRSDQGADPFNHSGVDHTPLSRGVSHRNSASFSYFLFVYGFLALA